MSDRSIAIKIATSKAGFTLSITEKETVIDEDGGNSHTEQEASQQDFAVFRSAAEAAGQTVKRFEQKLGAPEGELFG